MSETPKLETAKGGAVASNDQLDLSLDVLLHYLRNPYGQTEEQLRFYRSLAADKLERMDKLLKTPIAWEYKIAKYCDHAEVSGVVLDKTKLKNIPERYITWKPVFLSA